MVAFLYKEAIYANAKSLGIYFAFHNVLKDFVRLATSSESKNLKSSVIAPSGPEPCLF